MQRLEIWNVSDVGRVAGFASPTSDNETRDAYVKMKDGLTRRSNLFDRNLEPLTIVVLQDGIIAERQYCYSSSLEYGQAPFIMAQLCVAVR